MVNFKVRTLQLFSVAILAASLFGCGKPSETRRDNRRLFDAILTAIVIRNPTELAKDKELLNERQKAGTLSKKTCDAIQVHISSAEQGDWESAEKGLYELRKKEPFPY